MNTDFVLSKLNNSREALGELLGVKAITTYQPSWVPNLPPKHARYLRALKPDWAAEWDAKEKKAKRAHP